VRRRAARGAVPLLFLVGACWLFSGVVSGKYLTASSAPSFLPPFNAYATADVPAPQRALGDLTYILEPFLLHARGAIRSATLPLWDPHIGAGRPLGSAQAGPFSPLNWPAYLLPFWWSLGVILILKVLVAAVGTYAFLRGLRLSAAAAAFGGVAFAFGVPFIPLLGHGETSAFAFFPWCLLLLDRIVREERVTDALVMALVAAMVLYGGHPETILLVALGVAGYALFRIGERWRGEDRAPRRALALIAGAGFLSACIGAMALFPLAEVIRNSIELHRNGGGNLGHIGVGLFFPELWGRPDKHIFGPSGSKALSVDFAVRPYLGALAPVLAIGGMLRPRRAEQVFFAGLGLLSLLALLDTPVQFVVRHLPFLSFLAPYHFIWLVAFSAAVLAAFGVERLITHQAGGHNRRALPIAMLALAPVAVCLAWRPGLLASIGSGFQQVPSLRPSTVSADTAAAGAMLRYLALSGTAVLAFVLLRRNAARPAAFGAVLVALALVDLVTLGRGFFPFASRPAQHPPTTPSLTFLHHAGSDARMIGLEGALPANLADEYGVRDARVQALPKLERYTSLFTQLGGRMLTTYGWTLITEPVPQKLLDVFAVRYVLGSGTAPDSASLRTVMRHGREQLLANKEAFPRAWVAYGWRPMRSRDSALRDLLSRGAARIEAAPAIEGLAAARTPTLPPRSVPIRDVSDSRVDLHVSAREPAVVVLDDTYYPGWKATVDGRAAEVMPANVAFRAVRVGPGTHVVRFSYAPSWLGPAKALMLGGTTFALLGVVLGGLRRRRRLTSRSAR
jgi:hypothetical protein